MADRVHAESTLETARRAESVYGWLRFIGYDPTEERSEIRGLETYADRLRALFALYAAKPHELERDRRAGPSSVHRQRRMATLADYSAQLQRHPLVLRAQASERWGGAWPEVWVTVALWDDLSLPEALTSDRVPPGRRTAIGEFHDKHGLRAPRWAQAPTSREILRDYVRRFRMTGQEVWLQDVKRVRIALELRIQVGRSYFKSEVQRVIEQALGRGPGGFFAPGRLRFGEDLHLSDLYEVLMPLDGVDNVEVVRFGRVGHDATSDVPHVLSLESTEIAGWQAPSLTLMGGLAG
jgi:hypothetical protein